MARVVAASSNPVRRGAAARAARRSRRAGRAPARRPTGSARGHGSAAARAPARCSERPVKRHSCGDLAGRLEHALDDPDADLRLLRVAGPAQFGQAQPDLFLDDCALSADGVMGFMARHPSRWARGLKSEGRRHRPVGLAVALGVGRRQRDRRAPRTGRPGVLPGMPRPFSRSLRPAAEPAGTVSCTVPSGVGAGPVAPSAASHGLSGRSTRRRGRRRESADSG